MIIKSVSFITLLSMIGNNKGVQSSELLDTLLTFNGTDGDSFNVNCHHIAYEMLNIITDSFNVKCHHIAYEMLNIITGSAGKKTKRKVNCKNENDDEKTIKNQLIRNVDILIRSLHRVYYNHKKSPIRQLGFESWTFLSDLTEWINDINNENKERKVRKLAQELIERGLNKNIWNPLSLEIEEKLTIYNHCKSTLSLLTRPTEFMEFMLYIEFKQRARFAMNLDITDIMEKFEPKSSGYRMILQPSLEYGNIILLLKEEEIIIFKQMMSEHKYELNEYTNIYEYTYAQTMHPDDQRLYIINIMIEALVNAYDVINNLLDNIEISKVIASRFKDIKNQKNVTGIKLNIFITLYKQAIDTTEALYNIKVKRSTKNEEIKRAQQLKNDYIFFVDKVKAKWTDMCAELVLDEHKRSNDILEKPIQNYKEGRLTTYDSNSNKYLIRVPVFEYYSIILNKESLDSLFIPYIDNNDEIILLMEIHVWMVMLKKYAHLMETDEFLEKRRPYYTVNEIEGMNFDNDKTLMDPMLN